MSSTTSPVLSTAREVLDPVHLRTALRINPADATIAGAVRCGATIGLALTLSAAVGRTDLAGFAALGALASLYGRFDPYRRRAALLTGVSTLIVGSFVLMAVLTAAGTPAVVSMAVVALLAALATALCALARVGAPGATILVFAAAGGLAGPVGWDDVVQRSLACAAGAALAWVISMSGFLVRPSAPARLAVRRAADKVRLATAEPGTAGRPGAGAAAHGALENARRVLADDLSHRRTRDSARVLAADLATYSDILDAAEGRPTDRDAGPAPEPAAALPARQTLRDDMRGGRSTPWWRLASLRVTISGLVAGAVSLVAGLGHPAWAQMGATATLQGATTHHAVVRAVQRGGGTVLGALIAWPLLEAHLSFAATCLVVVALQVVTEIVVGRHYGIAMLTITPMALLMTSLSGVADPGAMALSRALDTLVGAALGVLAVVLIHPRVRGTVRDPATPASR